MIIHLATNSTSLPAYRDLIALKAETATFGDLADALREVAKRLPEEHFKICLAQRSHVKLRDLTDAKCIRGDSRERVAAVVAWDGGPLDRRMLSLIAANREAKRREKENRALARAQEEHLEYDYGP